MDITDLDADLTDFAETAAVIDALDLVIWVDTSVAHLAGALAKPVWILLPHPAEWRWLERRDDSPWYPTARLFRQRTRGDWEEVVERLTFALRAAVDARRTPPAVIAEPKPIASLKSSSGPRKMKPMQAVSGMSAVAEMRYGILQYLPGRDDTARSLAWYGEWLQPQLDLLLRLIRLRPNGLGSRRGNWGPRYSARAGLGA